MNHIKLNKWALLLIPVIGLCILTSCDADDTQVVTNFNNLVLADEFDTEGAPNPAVWAYEIGRGPNGDGWGNNELQYYTDRPANVRVDNGLLLITAREEAYQGAAYTSARLVTKGLFEQKYGRFEARIRLPMGQGLWPAFWLLGNDCDQNIWPACGEIDIMENIGSQPSKIFGSVHGPGYSAGESEGKDFILQGDRFDNDFHVFGIEWTPEYINYYVDDKLYNQITPDDVPGEWVYDGRPFYIILNMAVGGNLPGAPNAATEFPRTMAVDYVRVYSHN